MENEESSCALTTEKLIIGALARGLHLSDFEQMTVGMIFDYCITFNNEHIPDEEKQDEIRMATQADFDRF